MWRRLHCRAGRELLSLLLHGLGGCAFGFSTIRMRPIVLEAIRVEISWLSVVSAGVWITSKSAIQGS